MNAQYLAGEPIGDEASKVCILFDPKDGRIMHVHGRTVVHSRGHITESELEARARQHAEHFGKPVAGLKVLHVPLAAIRENGRLRVSAGGDSLIPSPRRSKRDRYAQARPRALPSARPPRSSEVPSE
jgi:hypothetical protein